MKVYQFNTDTGLYEGETFEESDMLQYEDGITPVPPPAYGHGQVPVFDRSRNEWSVLPITIVRHQLDGRMSECTVVAS